MPFPSDEIAAEAKGTAMADPEHLRILKQGVKAWNEWRQAHDRGVVDLSEADLAKTDVVGADLRQADLHGADLSETRLWANLIGADLSRTRLWEANLNGVDLSRTNLAGADLSGVDLSEANLTRANLTEANLGGTNLVDAILHEADLSSADFSGALLLETVFGNVNLSTCKNLETITHSGPSVIDTRTLQRSGRLPLIFLRGVGLPDTLIEYLPSLLGQAVQLYSCFISYSSKNDDFAQRLYADLQNKGVRCWFAPEDMKIGAKIRDTIDEAIRLRDKVLLVLSEASIASDWVEDEVDKAFEEERQRGDVVLFPVRLDDAVMRTNEAWAAKLRRNRNIGDFRAWKDHDAYQTALKRVLRDLQIDASPDRSDVL
ncbi:MAG: toll/interleukin-1 receptor domain-containing protein [Acidisphaera sp.]|nr:toll/interleukin-1 receptor domain-containing protein [Acidisphaera sp.]